MVQPLWNEVRQFLTKLNILLPAVTPLGIFRNEWKTYIHTKTYTQMFVAALSITTQNLEVVKMSFSR